MTAADQLREQGRLGGVEQDRREVLLEQLSKRLGPPTEGTLARVAAASMAQLRAPGLRVAESRRRT